MKSPRSIREEHYKDILYPLVKVSEKAQKVEERYNLMIHILKGEWMNTLSLIEPVILKELLHDVVYVDRKIRDATKEYQKEKKKILSQEYQIKNGYESSALVKDFEEALNKK